MVVRNYGVRPQSVDLGLQFSKSPAGSRRLTLRPGSEEQATFTYAAKTGGFLEARLNVRDAFPQDDRALVELPPEVSSHVVIYSSEPQLLRPLFAANPQVDAMFESPEKYRSGGKGRCGRAGSLHAAFGSARRVHLDPAARGRIARPCANHEGRR